MEIPGNLRVVCRLCWSYDLSLHWEDEMDECINLSYRDCFYKYTQFDESATDQLSQYLCEECAANIKSFHLMVEKSLQTLGFCEQLAVQKASSETTDRDDDLYSVHDFSLDQSNIDDQGHEINEIEIVRDDGVNFSDTENLSQGCELLGFSASSEHLPDSTGKDEIYYQDSDKSNNSNDIDCDEFEANACGLNAIDEHKLTITRQTKTSTPPLSVTANKYAMSQESDEKSSSKAGKTPGMCSYCSKIVHDIYYLKLHEQTHEENRQREVACTKCGIKLYDKRSLYQHMKIHEENRVKNYKCEFCDKAFFSRGSCNIHRRIHLGQMFQCPLCPKQFYRQIELNRHMPLHSHETLCSRSQPKPKKYYVHCKECDRKIASNRFNGHRASHINDPFMRCTLCEKDFCSRKSGGKHMARVHKRKGGDYDDITFYYQSKERPRLSLLLMKQQEDVEPVE